MLTKKLASVGAFACIYAFVYMAGSAIFGVVTTHVGDYQLLRLVLFSAVASVIAFIYFTLSRVFDRPLLYEYRRIRQSGKPFLMAHKGFRAELIVTLVVFLVVGFFLAMTDKQLIHGPGASNLTLACYAVFVGFPVFVLLDLASWAIVCAAYRRK